MQFGAFVTSALCLAAAQVVGAQNTTSVATTTITKTLVRVNSYTVTPSSSMVAATSPASTPFNAATASATPSPTHNAAVANMPAPLVAGALALVMGAAL